ncbi:MAG: DUF6287 domain-containing protein [Streptococcaceae bacterium]|jgi:hypothetical protein|nr:DUF6287 domain-containing protein [Streptococcaceae bacterium]
MKKSILLGGIVCASLLLVACANHKASDPTAKASKISKSTPKTSTVTQASSEVAPPTQSETTEHPTTAAPIAEQDLNIDAINHNDFSSLAGEWRNGNGETLIINLDGTTDKGTSIKGVQDSGATSTVPYANYGSSQNGDFRAIAALGLFQIGFSNPDGDQSDTSKARVVITQNAANYPAELYYYRVQ